MKLYNDQDFKVWIFDIETLKILTLLQFYNPDTGVKKRFEISKNRNDLKEFLEFYNSNNIDYAVGFNCIDFDGVIIQHIINNSYTFLNYTDNLALCNIIYQYVQLHIDNRKHNIRPQYFENQFDVKVLDVFTILGLDNSARSTSLKKAEFQLDMPSIEEMPIHHSAENLTDEEIEQVSDYCWYDIMATFEVFKLVLGQTEHPIYKANNQLQLRKDISDEFKINALNLSDIRMADELLSSEYAKKIDKPVKELPRKGTFRKEIRLKNCIPSYVKFESIELSTLLDSIKNKVIKQNDKYTYTLNYKQKEYTGGSGGLHSKNQNEIYITDENYQIRTEDVGSYYPALIVNNKIYPYHLGKELLDLYSYIFYKRLELKPLAKKDKKIKGITEAYKLILNSSFGKLGMMESWLYDKQAFMSVTLGGQLSLFMFIEKLELNGISVISANSDGIELMLPKDKKEIFEKIKTWWQETTKFTLEGENYNKIIYSTVNDYLAIKENGELKPKGDLITEFELWKNKSWRIVALATKEYFVNGTNPIDFINNHTNIYDFCIMARAKGEGYLELEEYTNNGIIKTKLKKIVRYYLTTGNKAKLYKRGIGTTGKQMNKVEVADNELGTVYIQYANQIDESKSINEFNVDKNQYILKCLKFIDRIKSTKKAQKFLESIAKSNQGELLLF
jgi:hypothetical protein